MKEVNKYIFFIGLGLLALAVFVNYIIVKGSNDKKVDDSLAKARKVKEEKRKAKQEEVNKQADEILQDLTIIKN
tara:strand:+ start:147 stop:368 length:222 start_codon:yes stop_codon:yes gene_type:complete